MRSEKNDACGCMLRLILDSTARSPAAHAIPRAPIRFGELVLLTNPFPLTPALSPREREQPGPAIGRSCAAGFVGRLTRILPLPEGEGRGGKRDARHAAGAQKQVCAPVSPRLSAFSLRPGGFRFFGWQFPAPNLNLNPAPTLNPNARRRLGAGLRLRLGAAAQKREMRPLRPSHPLASCHLY